MGLKDYLAGREQQDQLAIRSDTMNVLPAVTELRRRAIATLDEAHLHQQTEPSRDIAQDMEEEIQTLGALARELEVAVQALRKVVAIGDQLDRVESRLEQLLAPKG